MRSYRLYLYGRDQKIVGKSDFSADGSISALNMSDRIFRACGDTCVSYELWEGKTRIASPAISDRAAAMSNYEQQVVIDTEIALRDSWMQIGKSKDLLAALDALRGQAPN